MSFDYASLANTADELLAEFGQSVVISRRVSSVYNPATGENTIIEAAQSGVAVILDISTRDIDGTLVQAGDKAMYLSPVGISLPQVNDKVTLASSQVFTITNIKAVAPAGIGVLYEANIRA